jgi:hypothetical protein
MYDLSWLGYIEQRKGRRFGRRQKLQADDFSILLLMSGGGFS